MKTRLGLLFVLANLSVQAATLPYQGLATDSKGNPKTDSSYSIGFALYASPNAGSALWSETQLVAIKKGLFATSLGANVAIPDNLFNGSALYLGVSFGGGVEGGRLLLGTTPWANQAGSAARSTVADSAGKVAGLKDSVASLRSSLASQSSALASLSTTVSNQGAIVNKDSVGKSHLSDSSKVVVGLRDSVAALRTKAKSDSLSFVTQINLLSATIASNAATIQNQTATIASQGTTIASLSTTLADQVTKMNTVLALLQGVSRTGADIHFDGVNVYVRNGAGHTDASNGLGNLIVGYNTLRGDTSDHRTGSHNLVVGDYNSYSSYGGLVAGYRNSVKGPFASVSGGEWNEANALASSVSGGTSNVASAEGAAVSGGTLNTASGIQAAVSGGHSSTAGGWVASVAGGNNNSASGTYSTILGGSWNVASGGASTITGGDTKTNAGTNTVVP